MLIKIHDNYITIFARISAGQRPKPSKHDRHNANIFMCLNPSSRFIITTTDKNPLCFFCCCLCVFHPSRSSSPNNLFHKTTNDQQRLTTPPYQPTPALLKPHLQCMHVHKCIHTNKLSSNSHTTSSTQ